MAQRKHRQHALRVAGVDHADRSGLLRRGSCRAQRGRHPSLDHDSGQSSDGSSQRCASADVRTAGVSGQRRRRYGCRRRPAVSVVDRSLRESHGPDLDGAAPAAAPLGCEPRHARRRNLERPIRHVASARTRCWWPVRAQPRSPTSSRRCSLPSLSSEAFWLSSCSEVRQWSVCGRRRPPSSSDDDRQSSRPMRRMSCVPPSR